MQKNKINIILSVVGVLTVSIFFKNVVAESFINKNKNRAVEAKQDYPVALNQVEIEKLNLELNTSNKTIEGSIEDNVQVIEFDLESYSYPNLEVKSGVPVRLVINVDEYNLNSCNYIIFSSDFGFQKELVVGQNIIEFTPSDTGQYIYTCWMGMLGAYINVVDGDITPSATYGENVSAGGCCSR